MRRKYQQLKLSLETADLELIHAMVWQGPEEVQRARDVKQELMRQALAIRDEGLFLEVTGMTRSSAVRCYGKR